jgi:hypothetical protein
MDGAILCLCLPSLHFSQNLSTDGLAIWQIVSRCTGGDSQEMGICLLPGPFHRRSDPRNPCSGRYDGGEYTEVGTELALTAGSMALEQSTKGASRRAVRKLANKRIAESGIERAAGEQFHHVPALLGHLGGLPAVFLTGGLPVCLDPNSRTLRRVAGAAGNAAAYQSMRAWERASLTVVNPPLTAVRLGVAASGGCQG